MEELRTKYVAPEDQIGGAQVEGLGITQNGTTPITASSLAPATPYNLAPKNTETASVGLATQATTYATQAKNQSLKDEQKKIDAEKAQMDSSANDISSLLGEIGGQQAKKIEAYSSGGLNESKARIDAITSDMEAADLKARKQIEEIINSNPKGMSGSGAQGEIQRIQRQNASYQADQAIVLSALGRNYDRVKGIIDAKVDAETEGLKAKLEARKFFYENNKEQFTKDEQRKYEADLRTEQRQLDQEKADKTTLETTKAKMYEILNENGRQDLIQGVSRATDISSIYSAMNGVVSLDTVKKLAEINELKAKTINNVPITGEWASVINGASGLVANTKKSTVKANISNAITNNDFTTAYAEIKNAVSDGLNGTPKTKFDDANTDIAVLGGLRNAIQQYADARGDMSYLKGTTEKIERNFGQLKKDPKFATLAVMLEREFQTYRSNMTGAAFTPAESRDYASVNPTSNKNLDLNLSIIDGAIKGLENRVDSVVSQRVPDAKKIKSRIATSVLDEDTAIKNLTNFRNAHPEKVQEIRNLKETSETALGRKITVAEFLQVHPEFNQ